MNGTLEKMKIGLVLAGGGAKGAYEAGVYKALKELELVEQIKVISGTSIGAINALFFAMDDAEVINNSWSSLTYSRFILKQEATAEKSIPALLGTLKDIKTEGSLIEQIKASDIGLLSQAGIEGFIEEFMDMEQLKESGKSIYACAYNIEKEEPEYFLLDTCTKQEIKERVLASSAVPHMFKPVVIDGIRYADGGIQSPLYSKNNVDNVPIAPLRSHECDMILVVHLSNKTKVDRSGFEKAKVIELYPSKPLAMINGIGTVNIKQETLIQNIELGYRDAMVCLAPVVIGVLKGKRLEEIKIV